MRRILAPIALLALATSVLSGGEIPISTWKVLGPFLDGIRELDIDHLTAYGGEEKIVPGDDQAFYSIQPNGGMLKWFEVKAESPTIQVSYPGVDWEFMGRLYGSAERSDEFMNVGYAYTEISVPAKTRVFMSLQNVKTIWVNGLRQEGAYYTYGYDGAPAVLEKGRNRILLKFRGNGNGWFSCRVLTVEAAVRVLDDLTTPDIVRGVPLAESWLGVPLANVSDGWLRGLSLVVAADGIFDRRKVALEPVAPLSVVKIPVPLRQTAEPAKSAGGHDLQISVVEGDRVVTATKIPLRIRDLDQPLKITFRSETDGSVQYFGVRYPRDYQKEKTYALLVSLHGSGDEGLIMAEAHDAKEWAFVAAPSDRRPWGLEYHAWGSRDVQEVIAWMASHFPIDPDRISITGASMGGHGSLYQGLLFPSKFAAVAPEACFPSPLLYYSSLLQKSSVLAPPGVRYMVDRAHADRHLIHFAENALHLPLILTHGSADDNVPPFNPRFFVERARDLGLGVVYREIPSRPHFWFEPRTDPRQGAIWGVCVDHPDLMDVIRTQRRVALPPTLAFRCVDLSANDEYYWVRVVEQARAFDLTEVRAEVEGAAVRIHSINAPVLDLFLPPELVAADRVRILWNGKAFERDIPADRRVRLGSPTAAGLRRTPLLSGPIHNAFMRPFVLVYGTQGSAAETAILLNNARYFAKRTWNWINGFTRILSDREVSPEILRDFNVILFGAPHRNSLTGRVSASLPVRLEPGRVVLGEQTIVDADLAVGLVYPNPLNPSRLLALFAGTTPEMEALAAKIQPIDRRISFPDFVVAGRDFDRDGWAGVRALGFFSPSWDLSTRDYYVYGQPD